MNCEQTIAAAVVGSIVGTLALCGLVVGLVFLIRYHLKKKRKQKQERSKHSAAGDSVDSGLHNEAFEDDMLDNSNFIMMMAEDGGSKKRVLPKSHVKKSLDKTPSFSAADADMPALPAATADAMNEESLPASRTSPSTLDDVHIDEEHHECVEVKLVSKDIIGLGFNVKGNMRDGIIVSKVHDRGPAKDSGAVSTGDKVLSVTISFENVVYEDALTILSYASPYPVTLKLAKAFSTSVSDKRKAKDARVFHPMYRSQSLGDINKGDLTVPRSNTAPYISAEHTEGETSDETQSDCGTLRKNKFGNTLNLTETRDSMVGLEKRESSLSMSQNNDSSTPSLTTEQDSQNSLAQTVMVDIAINQPPETSSPKHDASAMDETQETVEDSTSRKAPAHLPASIRNLVESKRSAHQAVEAIEANVAASAQQEKNNNDNVSASKNYQTFAMSEGALSALDSLIGRSTQSKESTQTSTELSGQESNDSDGTATQLMTPSSTTWLQNESESFATLAEPSLTSVQVNASCEQQPGSNLVIDTEVRGPADLPSPNDSGIHSELLSGGESAPQSSNNASPASISSKQSAPIIDQESSSIASEDILAAVMNVHGTTESDNQPSSTTQSTLTTSISPPTIPSETDREDDGTQAKSRSQLEAARAQFFADLISSSSIFTETPKSLTLSSESLTLTDSPPTSSRMGTDDSPRSDIHDNNNSPPEGVNNAVYHSSNLNTIPPKKPKRLHSSSTLAQSSSETQLQQDETDA